MGRIESGVAGVTASTFGNTVLVSAGRDPFELVQRGVAAAARLSGELAIWCLCLSGMWRAAGCHAEAGGREGRSRVLALSFLSVLPHAGSARPRAEKVVPPSVDVFGWCTWDA